MTLQIDPVPVTEAYEKSTQNPNSTLHKKYSMYTQMLMYSILASRVDALVMRQLKID